MVLYGILLRDEVGEAISFTALSVKSPEAALEWAKGAFEYGTIEVYILNGPLWDPHNII